MFKPTKRWSIKAIAAVWGGMAMNATARDTKGIDMVQERNQKLDFLLAQAMPEIKAHWQRCREAGMDVMTQAATDAVDGEIGAYFQRLKALNAHPSEAQILAEMERLYDRLNALNEAKDNGLLETDERELLVPLFVEAAVICGIDAARYDGEPGGEYRDF